MKDISTPCLSSIIDIINLPKTNMAWNIVHLMTTTLLFLSNINNKNAYKILRIRWIIPENDYSISNACYFEIIEQILFELLSDRLSWEESSADQRTFFAVSRFTHAHITGISTKIR